MLNVEHLEFSYKHGIPVLKDISFTAEQGEILCLLGPNGTGKTTLLRCILGLYKPKSGTITYNGTDVLSIPNKKRAMMMAYVPQSSALSFPYNVRDVVMMGRVSHVRSGASYSADDRQICLDCLERLQILHLAERSFQELSGGERQMVLVARALAQQSSLLIMDEPTASLDYSNQIKILKTIRYLAEQGYTILMTSHFPDHAFLACSKAVLMSHGVIVSCGAPEETVTTASLSDLYSAKVCVTDVTTEDKQTKVCIPMME